MKIYEQICQDLKRDIINKKIKQGERLPSLIAISRHYQCSKGTVIKAFEQLRTQRIIFSKPQSGYYVADNLMREDDHPKGFLLDSGNPTIGSFSTFDVSHCLHLAAELYSKYSIDVTLSGVPSLNALLPDYLAREGVYAKTRNIHLIQGITPVLTFLTLYPFPNGKKTVLIEEPTSKHYVSFLKSIDVNVLTIRRDETGIDLKQLEAYFKHGDIKFFFVIPRNHNPLGTILSHHQRKTIMELALKYDVYIVEDDYFGGTHKLPKYVPIHFFSYQKHCIYLRSFSKVLPMLRIAIAVIPDEFQETFDTISQQSYYYSYHMPDLISQATYEAYLRSSLFEKHYAQISHSIHEKLKLARGVTSAWDPRYVSLIGAKSGYYFTLKLHPDMNVDTVVSKLHQKNIYIASNERAFYNSDNFDNSVRISIAKVSLEHLKEVLHTIYEVILDLKTGE
ncbi:MAG: PLP-dependent aminotransferase family protein [Oscillospiraceae bacterium]|nr:PLP-dependent aminotransferase family protein [Oscillospiraceae bacterium]